MSAIPERDNYGRPSSEYVAKVSSMDDDALVGEVANKVYLSAYAANNPRSDYHWHADVLYDEARRREKPWLYQRGWNQAYRLAGYEPSESEVEQAKAREASS